MLLKLGEELIDLHLYSNHGFQIEIVEYDLSLYLSLVVKSLQSQLIFYLMS